MYKFILNGKNVETNEDITLLEYLREKENLTSVKNGCSEGACGTCMIIVDGKSQRACIQRTSKTEDKEVTTVEGFSKREKEVYSYAFAEVGAVQCGFCIPGMLISAKVLIDSNPNPSSEDVKKGIRANICRCTGYVKIEEAILLSAKIFRENQDISADLNKGKVGERLQRIDAKPKALGEAIYVDDMKLEGMLYGSALRTEHPRALVKSINTDKAKSLDGVVAIYTAEDIPGQRNIGHIVKDWDAMIEVGEYTRYLGDSLALIVAKSKEILEKAKKLIEVEYEIAKPITSPVEALKEDSPKIHKDGNLLRKEHLIRGNADEVIKNAKHVVSYNYSVPPTEHAFLEPECALAEPYKDGVLVYTSSQSIFDEQREISELLGIDIEKVRVKSQMVGGGFGGKEDMSVQHHAALLAYLTKKPVKVLLSRKESIIIHPKRHAMEMKVTTACDESGILLAMKADIVSDTGAYASLGGPVLQRACTHAAGPYNYQTIDILGRAVYTNNPPAGAFRGFGVTQTVFATECNLNKLAELVGISPWEIRYLNAIKPGQVLPNGQIADEGTALIETLEAVKDEYENAKFAGIACAMKNAGLGVGIPDIGRVRLSIIDGKVHIRSGAACIGQGLGTVLTQIFCETTGINYELLIYEKPDTALTPDSGTTTASRQTLLAGEACKRAAEQLNEALREKSLDELEGKDFFGEFLGKTDPLGSEKENPISHIAYGYATQVVILNDEGRLVKVLAAHDVGHAINPTTVEGQIEGGVVMGLGYALTEDYPLENAVPTAKFGTLGLFRASDVPQIETFIIEENKKDGLAYGAKGVGEITCIPTAAAVQNAYYNFDGKFRTSLPLEGSPYDRKKR